MAKKKSTKSTKAAAKPRKAAARPVTRVKSKATSTRRAPRAVAKSSRALPQSAFACRCLVLTLILGTIFNACILILMVGTIFKWTPVTLFSSLPWPLAVLTQMKVDIVPPLLLGALLAAVETFLFCKFRVFAKNRLLVVWFILLWLLPVLFAAVKIALLYHEPVMMVL